MVRPILLYTQLGTGGKSSSYHRMYVAEARTKGSDLRGHSMAAVKEWRR